MKKAKRKAEQWELEKIAERQAYSVSQGLLTQRQLDKFLELAADDGVLCECYFARSPGWSTQIERYYANKGLAQWIKETLKVRKG
jgi:hypothetical protein